MYRGIWVFNAIFVKIALKLQKELLSIAFYPDPFFLCFWKLRKFSCAEPVVECVHEVIYKTNEGYKLFGNTQTVAKLSALSSVFSSCIICALFSCHLHIRSSYTYAQTDLIKYDSMRPRLLRKLLRINR